MRTQCHGSLQGQTEIVTVPVKVEVAIERKPGQELGVGQAGYA